MKNLLLVYFFILLAACSAAPASSKPSEGAPAPVFTTAPPPPSAAAQNHPTGASPAPLTSPLPPAYVWPTRFPLSTSQPGAPVVLLRFAMIDQNIGWGMDTIARRLRTVDGGHSWKNITPPGFGLFFARDGRLAWDIAYIQIPCLQAGCPDGWMRGFEVWHTADGGQTWQAGKPFPSGWREFFPINLQFVNDRMGWYLGRNGYPSTGLFQSADGGDSWQLIQHFSDGCYSASMVFLDERQGWIGVDCSRSARFKDGTPLAEFLQGKDRPALNRTLDGGLTWHPTLLPAPAVFPAEPSLANGGQNSRFFCGVKQMERISEKGFLLQWVCALNYPDAARVISYAYLTPDGGKSWNSWLSSGNENFIDSATGWRLFTPGGSRPNVLQQTSSGGLTWTNIREVGWQSAQIDFVSGQVGWALVSDGQNTVLVRSADGGLTWLEIEPAYAP